MSASTGPQARSTNGRALLPALAVGVGLLQTAGALAVLFLPVIQYAGLTTDGQETFSGRSYIEEGGNALGYSLLILMALAGAVVAASAYDTNRARMLLIRRAAFLFSLFVVVITIFSIGLYFVPSTLLLLLVAALTSRTTADR